MATTDWRGLYTVPEINYGAQYTGRDDWIHPTNKSLNNYYDHRAYRGSSSINVQPGLDADYGVKTPSLGVDLPESVIDEPLESTRSRPTPIGDPTPGLSADYGARTSSLTISDPTAGLPGYLESTRSRPQPMGDPRPGLDADYGARTSTLSVSLPGSVIEGPLESTRSRATPMPPMNPGLSSDYGVRDASLSFDVPSEARMNVPAVRKQSISNNVDAEIRKAGEIFSDLRGIAENIQVRKR